MSTRHFIPANAALIKLSRLAYQPNPKWFYLKFAKTRISIQDYKFCFLEASFGFTHGMPQKSCIEQ